MTNFKRNALISGLMLVGAQLACAGTDLFFNPLVQSSAVAMLPNHINELNNPWQTPAGITVRNLTSLHEIEADPGQSTVRVPGLGSNASMTDMSAFDPHGRYIFLPHETAYGAGLTRYDTATDKATNLFRGDMNGAHGDWRHDYGAFDPATWTPVDTLLVGEEWSGEGRIFEVMNPLADVVSGEAIVKRELNSIPNVAHEGLRFNHAGTALYFIDEDKSGAIYKFVPSIVGDYSQGQSFVLVVDAFAGDPASHWNVGVNASAVRTGAAHWEALTDAQGVAQTATDPFRNGPSRSSNPDLIRGGRAAADEVNATPFGRPEDIEVGYLSNGHEVLYFTATSEQAIYSVEELGDGQARVRLAASSATPTNLGTAPTTGRLSDPDNLAQDALGNIYVVEDKPNGDAVGGDVWFLRDTNGDGVAESLDHFLSLQVKGAENTGMIFDPAHPARFIINVQHPESTDLSKTPNGQGDATWLFDLEGVVAPPCPVGNDSERDDREADNANLQHFCEDNDETHFVHLLKKVDK